MLGVKNTVTKMKSSFEGLSTLDIAEVVISELEDISTETSQTQSKEKKSQKKKKKNIQEL